MLAWLMLMHDKLSWLKPLEAEDGEEERRGKSPPSEAEQQLAETQSLVNDMMRQTPEREAVTRAALALMEMCTSDQSVIQQQLAGIDSAWTVLHNGKIDRCIYIR